MGSMDALHKVARTQDMRDGFVLIDRIASLEAERKRLRECIIKFIDNCLRDEEECPYCREAAALVGGEVK